MMVLSGVRSSWLMLARKRDLPLLSASAAALASTRPVSRAFWAVASRTTANSRPSAAARRLRAMERSGSAAKTHTSSAGPPRRALSMASARAGRSAGSTRPPTPLSSMASVRPAGGAP